MSWPMVMGHTNHFFRLCFSIHLSLSLSLSERGLEKYCIQRNLGSCVFPFSRYSRKSTKSIYIIQMSVIHDLCLIADASKKIYYILDYDWQNALKYTNAKKS